MAEFIRRSRLERKNDEQITKKTLILGAITIGIFVLIIVFGLPLLVKFAVFLGETKNKNDNNANKEKVLPPLAPRIFVPYEATNSAQINISGVAEPKSSVELLKDEVSVQKVDVSSGGDFTFSNVTLDKGNNTFTAVATGESGERSSVSPELSIAYIDQPPEFTLTNPSQDEIKVDNAEYEVSGKSDKGVSVTVNGRVAVVDNDGNFKAKIELNQGKNDVEIIVTDIAGNQAKKTVSITYDF